MAGQIIISNIKTDSDNAFSILANTGAVLFSANLASGITTGIADSSITNAKLAGSITGDKITVGTLAGNVFTANTITGDKIGQNSISSNNIVSVNGSTVISSTVTPAKLSQPFTSGTAVASTSGTSIDFTSIPSWVKRVTVMFAGVSTSGASVPIIQLGAGSVTTTGYVSSSARLQDSTAVSVANSTVGFVIPLANASNVFSGAIQFTNVTGNTWVGQGVLSTALVSPFSMPIAGLIALVGTLDRVRFTTVNGTDTFDAGSINILYE